jgi:IS5 family transposase
MLDHTELFCTLDDFCKVFEPFYRQSLKDAGITKRTRRSEISLSEIMLIAVWFHQAHVTNFKHFIGFIRFYHRKEFPTLPSYERVSALVNQHAPALAALFEATCIKADPDHIFMIDSTSLPVCNNKRIRQHRTFKQYAARAKTSMGWFYGFKLHLVINRACEIVSARITAGNISDVSMMKALLLRRNLQGKVYGDKGYISSEKQQYLQQHGCKVITRVRSNMAEPDLSEEDEHYLSQRNSIEVVNGQHKCGLGLQHTRHRSWNGLFAHVYGVMVGYQLCKAKSKIRPFDGEAYP